MPNWTKEQEDAINLEGRNIIVSAGAGSGKTAVLTARVIRKLKQGIDINKLLVLTFTNEAAREMKERIRKSIRKEPDLKEQLDYIDAAYITTFDSYALSIVKKYHYLLNIKKDISIIDSSIINIKKEEILNDIFEELYKQEDNEFLCLIKDFCVKDDTNIKKSILKISNILDLKIDKDNYLNNYLEEYYSDDYLNNIIDEYIKMIISKISNLNNMLYDLKINAEGTYYQEVEDVLLPLLSSLKFDDIKNNSRIKIPNVPRNSSNELKNTKKQISDQIKLISNLIDYENLEEIKNNILMTKSYLFIIIKIINKLDYKINNYKNIYDAYEFIDISKLAIKVVQDNEEIKEELKHYYNEIMVDEYQDTNDLQEQFISLIENNNVYMVGDVKQSIYRFRNANPEIFKNKYTNYEKNNGGLKIDLLKNFRSRSEVLNNINNIFDLIMDLDIGGADYKDTHQMIFGNNTYINEGKTSQNNNLEIYNYSYDTKEYSREEIEIFIVAKDIKDKVDNHYQIFDKDNLLLRDIAYSDFCIIMDRNTEFDKYKQIFEYLEIPLVLYKDNKLTSDIDTILIKNILNFIIKVKNQEFDNEFKYCFISIARSYLFSMNDNIIFEYFKDNNFKDNEIYRISYEISKYLDNVTNLQLLNIIIEQFKFYEKLMTVGSIEESMIKIEYLQNLSVQLSTLGYTPYMFENYLEEMINSDNDIKYSLNTNSGNNVKIMNIHKSKGLEFHICYYTGLHKEFNIMDLKERFSYDNKYGIITPYFKEGIGNTILTSLVKDNYMKEEISEKIRLFYVALTRCKEKMIIVTNLSDIEYQKISDVKDSNERLKYRSFLDILNSIKGNLVSYIKNIDLNNILLTKNYNLIKNKNYLDYIKNNNQIINKININIENEILEDKTYSKNTYTLVDNKTKENMNFGIFMHYLFEIIDFKNNDLIIDSFYKEKIDNFLNQAILKDIDRAKIYKEYEFMYYENNINHHGIIDLMLEYDDYIKIIDYKLKNIDDENYLNQLNGYKNYIENKVNKKVYVYLYSILENSIKEI